MGMFLFTVLCALSASKSNRILRIFFILFLVLAGLYCLEAQRLIRIQMPLLQHLILFGNIAVPCALISVLAIRGRFALLILILILISGMLPLHPIVFQIVLFLVASTAFIVVGLEKIYLKVKSIAAATVISGAFSGTVFWAGSGGYGVVSKGILGDYQLPGTLYWPYPLLGASMGALACLIYFRLHRWFFGTVPEGTIEEKRSPAALGRSAKIFRIILFFFCIVSFGIPGALAIKARLLPGECTILITDYKSSEEPEVAAGKGGRRVFVWTDRLSHDGHNSGVFSRIIESGKTSQDKIAQVNTYTKTNQESPAVAMDSQGNYVVVWQSSFQDVDFWGVFGQRFANDGTPNGTEFQVNSIGDGSQTDPDVAMSPDGRFVVVWIHWDGDISIQGRMFDSDANPIGGDFRINTSPLFKSFNPTIAMNQLGEFVVVWNNLSVPGGGEKDGIYGRRFDRNGQPLGDDFIINKTPLTWMFTADVDMNDTGQWIVVWSRQGDDRDTMKIFGRFFDKDETPRNEQFPVLEYIQADWHGGARVALNDNGEFIAVWQTLYAKMNFLSRLFYQTGPFSSLKASKFDRAGNRMGDPVKLDTPRALIRWNWDVEMIPEGGYVVVWDAYSPRPFQQKTGIRAQHLSENLHPMCQ